MFQKVKDRQRVFVNNEKHAPILLTTITTCKKVLDLTADVFFFYQNSYK